MHLQFFRYFSIFAQLVAALLCTISMSAAQAHSGHEANKHQLMKAVGGDFTLTSNKGPVSLRDFHGKVVVIYFGYSHCADFCPIELGMLGRALKSMTPQEVEQIQPLFITVDPVRDDAMKMAAYSESFHPKLIGLTGSETEIAAVAKAYGISYEKEPVNATGGYDIDLPSVVFLVGRHGDLSQHHLEDVSPQLIVAALRKALKKKM